MTVNDDRQLITRPHTIPEGNDKRCPICEGYSGWSSYTYKPSFAAMKDWIMCIVCKGSGIRPPWLPA